MNPLLMPICGLSFSDVSLAALQCGGNKVRTAKRLGVGVQSLNHAIRRENLQHWFVKGRGKAPRPRQTCVSREQIIEVAKEGYTRADAAHVLGISPAYLKDLIKRWELSGYFIGHAESCRKTRHGYAV